MERLISTFEKDLTKIVDIAVTLPDCDLKMDIIHVDFGYINILL